MSKVTGVFGGSFDPVHLGHLHIAETLIEQGKVERVLFIPAARAPHKRGRRPASEDDRMAMLKLAVAGNESLAISTFELERGGLSYTIDTVEHFSALLGEKLRVIIGMDSLVDLHKWYRSQELVGMAQFLTYARPASALPSFGTLASSFGEERAGMLLAGVVQAELYDISSTEVRKRCRQRKTTEGLLPQSVSDYINEHKLYE